MKKVQYIKDFALKGNWKAFSFFLLFTLFIWLIVQFSQEYNYHYKLEVEILHQEVDKKLDTKTFVLPLKINETGFKIVRHSWKNISLQVNSDKLKNEDNQLVFEAKHYHNQIASLFDLDPINIDFNSFSKRIDFIEQKTKKIPIKHQIDISFEKSYNSLSGLQLRPDSLLVSGSESMLSKIEFLKTEAISLKNIKQNQKGSVKIVNKSEAIELGQAEVDYHLEVEKVTEKKVDVPIEIINLPQNKELNIFPKNIEVSFILKLEDFNRFSADDFQIICDFDKRFEEEGFMLATLKSYPNKISRPKLAVKKIDYLILDQ
ncbi:MAG: CdaR family protein [Bacteroidota bacterium]